MKEYKLSYGTLEIDMETPSMKITKLQSKVDRLQRLCNVLADELAKYNGTTVPGTVRWAEKEREG